MMLGTHMIVFARLCSMGTLSHVMSIQIKLGWRAKDEFFFLNMYTHKITPYGLMVSCVHTRTTLVFFSFV